MRCIPVLCNNSRIVSACGYMFACAAPNPSWVSLPKYLRPIITRLTTVTTETLILQFADVKPKVVNLSMCTCPIYLRTTSRFWIYLKCFVESYALEEIGKQDAPEPRKLPESSGYLAKSTKVFPVSYLICKRMLRSSSSLQGLPSNLLSLWCLQMKIVLKMRAPQRRDLAETRDRPR